MGPEVVKVDPEKATFEELRPVVNLLLRGGIVAGPTQTFYALMASADRPQALTRLTEMKGRDGHKPFLLLLDSILRVQGYARELPDSAQGLAKEFWPGPLTLLLRAQPGLHLSLVGPTRTVGVRVEGLPVIRRLVRSLDRAVTGTSANPGGSPPARTVEEVMGYFEEDLDMVLDGGPCPGGKPSTLIDVSLGPPRMIRDGGLSLNRLLAAAPDLRT